MINVKTDGGAVGDGSTDDHDALQTLIDAADGALYFPTGRYRIESTLVFPPKTGHHLIGCGMAQKPGPASPGARAAIVWAGGANGTMIECQGTGLVWNGLTLWGVSPVNTNGRADVGIHICNSCVSSSIGGQLDEAGKYWFPAIMIDDCATGIKAEGTAPADSCAFGYFWPRNCDICVHLNGTLATMFSFRYIIPLSSDTIFKVTNGGGRIYVQSVNTVMTNSGGEKVVLDVSGVTEEGGFFHLNGVTGDGGTDNYYLLKNEDSGDGKYVVRVTNSHFTNTGGQDQVAKVLIDRSGSTSGQTVLELVGCRGLDEGGRVLTNKVTIVGPSSSNPSRLIIRDSDLLNTTNLIDPATSSQHYTINRIKNWRFNSGLQSNASESG